MHAWYQQLIETKHTQYVPFKITVKPMIVVGNIIIDHSGVVVASPFGVAPTTSSFPIEHLVSMDWAEATARRGKNHLSVGIRYGLY